MLTYERNKRYIVYPSWANGQIVYSWRDLPAVFADPLQCPYLSTNTRVHIQTHPGDYPIPPQPATYITGPWDGGVIVVEAGLGQRWLPEAIMRNLADPSKPDTMVRFIPELLPAVSYLEPTSDLRRGYEVIGWGKAPKLYVPPMLLDHADSAGDEVYVLARYSRGKGRLRGMEDLVSGYVPFGLELSAIVSPRPEVQAEADAWAPTMTELSQEWHQVLTPIRQVDYLFAVTLYNALRLREVAGRRLISVHLVADIEGRPACMGQWCSWSLKVTEHVRNQRERKRPESRRGRFQE